VPCSHLVAVSGGHGICDARHDPWRLGCIDSQRCIHDLLVPYFQASGGGQPEPRAPVHSGRRLISLLEFPKYSILAFLRNADTGVFNAELDTRAAFVRIDL